MTIRLYSDNINKIYLGNSEIEKLYLGDILVFGGGGVKPEIVAILSFTPAVVGNLYHYDSSSIIAGAITYGYNGLLPAWLDFSTTTGVFSGVPDSDQDIVGISVYGINAEGSGLSSNIDTIEVSKITENCELTLTGASSATPATQDTYTGEFSASLFLKFEAVTNVAIILIDLTSTISIRSRLNSGFKIDLIVNGVGHTINESLILHKNYEIRLTRDSTSRIRVFLYDGDTGEYINHNAGTDNTTAIKSPTFKSYTITQKASFTANSTTTTWNMDSGSLIAEVSEEFPSNPAYNLNYTGVLADDWECFLVGAPMISTWETKVPNEIIALPFVSGYDYDCYIDWGDGTSLQNINEWDDNSHSYNIAGIYPIKIYKKLPAFSFGVHTTYVDSIIAVNQLGKCSWELLDFLGATLDYMLTGDYSLIDANISNMLKNVTVPCIDKLNTTEAAYVAHMFDGSLITRPDAAEKALLESSSGLLLEFDGTNYAELDTVISPSGDFTLELKDVVVADVNESNYIIGGVLSTEDCLVIDTNSGNLRFFAYVGTALVSGGPIESAGGISSGVKFDIKVTLVSGVASLYINDALQDSATWNLNGNQNIKYIGHRQTLTSMIGSITGLITLDDRSWRLNSGSITTEKSEEFPDDPAYNLSYISVSDDWEC